MEILNKEDGNISMTNECKNNIRINWKNMNIVEEYSKKANIELRKVKFNNTSKSKCTRSS